MRSVYLIKSIFIFSFVILCHANSRAQNYGLGFFSHEVQQDQRTFLDLSPEKDFCLSDNFSISFDLSFADHQSIYFGYVIRIIENDKRNFDLIYNTSKNQFDVIIGDSLSRISFNIARNDLFDHWNHLKIDFNGDRNELKVTSKGKSYIQKNVRLAKGACYKLLFGANKFEPFATTDVPPMKIRNIRILKNGDVEHYWPLDETDGNIAVDVSNNKRAVVNNPHWQTALHSKWQKAKPITVNGMASVAFDAEAEEVNLVGADDIYAYSIKNGAWLHKGKNSRVVLNQGNRSFYNPADRSLYNYFLGKESASIHNLNKGDSYGNLVIGDVTGNWHGNKMYSVNDSSLYFFGGYGYLRYKNTVQRYSFNSHQWNIIKTKGDFFTPRYLAGLGATTKGDTAYIIGGYGNVSGQQILNPRNLYDMTRFTVKDKAFKKLYELKINTEDFAFANSLVIDSKKGTYYGLVYPRHKYKSYLQLIKGALQQPDFQKLGSSIPYTFNDVHSFADLYYCQKSKKFVAVMLFTTDDNQTTVNVYTLLGPPQNMPKKIASEQGKAKWYIWAIAGLTGLAALAYFKRKHSKNQAAAVLLNKQAGNGVASADVPQLSEIELAGQLEASTGSAPVFKNAILLFGDMQVFDCAGNNITKLFTPLIKELFLFILLHSVKLGRGVSSEKLNEMFWFDKSEKSARNNRSVAIVKLKSLLEKLEHCRLSKDSGYWMIDIDHQYFYIDYHSYLNIINNRKRLTEDAVQQLSNIVQRGSFLSTSEYDWLDRFKSEISNDTINIFLQYLRMPAYHSDPETSIKIASFILSIDPVNEEAVSLKCRSFVALGKHSLAKNTFENFQKAYKLMYDKNFDKDFNFMLEKSSI